VTTVETFPPPEAPDPSLDLPAEEPPPEDLAAEEAQ
jgi:hypothetical protein